MLALLDPKFWLAIAMTFGIGYFVGRIQQYRADETKHKAALYEAAVKAKLVEDNLRDALEGVQDVHAKDLLTLSAQRDRALAELRSRPARLPQAALSACAGSGGAELSKPDAEFLVGESARADAVSAHLRACEARERATFEALTRH